MLACGAQCEAQRSESCHPGCRRALPGSQYRRFQDTEAGGGAEYDSPLPIVDLSLSLPAGSQTARGPSAQRHPVDRRGREPVAVGRGSVEPGPAEPTPHGQLSRKAEAPDDGRTPPNRRDGCTRGPHRLPEGLVLLLLLPISTDGTSENLTEVDHFFTWSMIGPEAGGAPIDGVRNLVLTCHRCGNSHEKTNRPPHLRYVERLHRRIEFLIASQHPLRPTLIAQTGASPADRALTLRRAHGEALAGGVRSPWVAPEELTPTF